MHPGQDEHFAIKEGVLAGKIGRKPLEARAGEEVFAPAWCRTHGGTAARPRSCG